MKGSEIIPIKVRTAAKRLIEYLDDKEPNECCLKLLKTIEAMPVTKRHPNPNVKVEFYFSSWREGSFSEDYTCTLASYILIMCLHYFTGDVRYSYGDRIGKHSEVIAKPDEFEVEWIPDDSSTGEDKGDWSWLTSDVIEFEHTEELWNKCLEWLKGLKPDGFLPESDVIPNPKDFYDIFEAEVVRLEEKKRRFSH